MKPELSTALAHARVEEGSLLDNGSLDLARRLREMKIRSDGALMTYVLETIAHKEPPEPKTFQAVMENMAEIYNALEEEYRIGFLLSVINTSARTLSRTRASK